MGGRLGGWASWRCQPCLSRAPVFLPLPPPGPTSSPPPLPSSLNRPPPPPPLHQPTSNCLGVNQPRALSGLGSASALRLATVLTASRAVAASSRVSVWRGIFFVCVCVWGERRQRVFCAAKCVASISPLSLLSAPYPRPPSSLSLPALPTSGVDAARVRRRGWRSCTGREACVCLRAVWHATRAQALTSLPPPLLQRHAPRRPAGAGRPGHKVSGEGTCGAKGSVLRAHVRRLPRMARATLTHQNTHTTGRLRLGPRRV